MTAPGPYDHEEESDEFASELVGDGQDEQGEDEQRDDSPGVTEEFEAEFGDKFGADVADELTPEDDDAGEEGDHPAGAESGASEAEEDGEFASELAGDGEDERAGDEQPAGIDVTAQETVEADVLALGDEEEARERAEREADEEVDEAAAEGLDHPAGAESGASEAEEGGEFASELAGDGEDERAGDEQPAGTEEEEAPEPAAVAPVGRPPAEEPPRAALWPRFLAASLVIVISVATATSVSILLYLSDIAKGLGGLPQVQDQLEAVEGGDPQNILVLGSDKRPDLEGDPGRSDTTMLLRLDPDNDAIALLSLPRDLKVNIPGYGVGKLNDAYAVGGPEKTLQVVKGLTGLKIHHVVNVDFAGFEKAIDAIDCVYVDVDRRYFNSNEALAGDELYAEIDIQAGYQMLCGERALQYVRYRHTDNDIVRAARQQDFLREARQKIGPTRLFRDREELVDIFKKYTTSDIDNEFAMLDVLKTFLGAATAPVKQIHFEGNLGETYVTASDEQIQKAVEQFLGIKDTPGSLGEEGGERPKRKPKKNEKEKKPDAGPALTDVAGFAAPYAEEYAPEVGFPVFYPTKLVPGSEVTDESRQYKIADEDGKVHTAYKFVFSIPGTSIPFEYYGLMGTTWTDPPILDNPTGTRETGGREYGLFFDGDRLRMIAWRTDRAAYWLSNTLLQTLEEDEMIAIADSMDEVAPPKKNKKKKK
jgi:LCP family protein required for cell wall assembly